MNSVLLVAEAGSLRVGANDSATANIWLMLNGHEFPTRGWNDFAIVIMGWWADALLRLLRNTSRQELIQFMEGPYAVEITLNHPGKLMFRALQGPTRSTVTATSESAVLPFIQDFILRTQELLDACNRHDWWSKDAEILKSALHALRSEAIRIHNS